MCPLQNCISDVAVPCRATHLRPACVDQSEQSNQLCLLTWLRNTVGRSGGRLRTIVSKKNIKKAAATTVAWTQGWALVSRAHTCTTRTGDGRSDEKQHAAAGSIVRLEAPTYILYFFIASYLAFKCSQPKHNVDLNISATRTTMTRR